MELRCLIVINLPREFKPTAEGTLFVKPAMQACPRSIDKRDK